MWCGRTCLGCAFLTVIGQSATAGPCSIFTSCGRGVAPKSKQKGIPMAHSISSHRPRVDDDSVVSGVTQLIHDVDDAAYQLAHSYPGGVPALALRMGINGNTLQLKVNPNTETHKLSLREAVHAQVMAGDCRILYAMAAALNHVCLPVPTMEEGEVSLALANVGAEVGDVFREVQRVLSDRRVTQNERRDVAKQVSEAMAALAMVMRVL